MRKTWKAFAFDFDGTLVDSYSCLPAIYRSIAKQIGLPREMIGRFVKKAIEYEDMHDYLGNYDRKTWWPDLFAEFDIKHEEEFLDKLLKKFWEMRAEKSTVIEGCTEVLEVLKNKGFVLVIIAGNDGQKSIKRMRIEKSGLAKYFDNILIVGEDVRTRVEAIEFVARNYKLDFNEIVFVDDKPSPINEVKAAVKEIVTVKVEFEGILKLAWKEKCKTDFVINHIKNLLEVCELSLL